MRYLFEDYALDTDRHELRRADTIHEIEPQVFNLLAFLIANRDRMVTQDELLARVWEGRIVSESTFRSRINAARVAIGDNGEDQRLIRTVPRKGFRFVGEVREEQAAVGGTPPASITSAGLKAGSDAPSAVSATALLSKRAEPPADQAALSVPASVRAAYRPAALLAAGAALATIAATAIFLVWPRSNGPLQPSSPTAVNKFDPSIVPMISEEGRRTLVNYAGRPDYKAIAIAGGHLGVADAAPDIEAAKQEALRRCNARSRRPCQMYAVGTDVVWTKDSMPLPDPEDLRTEPLDITLVPDEVPLLSRERRRHLTPSYMDRPDHRALALTLGRNWTITDRQTLAEAARFAIDLCSESAHRACLVISVDGFLTIQIPKSRKVIDVFLPSTHKELAEADRKRIAQVYRGHEWRALARGKKGSWHPVSDAATELAAIDAANASCRMVDDDCQLYAIGNFLVGPK